MRPSLFRRFAATAIDGACLGGLIITGFAMLLIQQDGLAVMLLVMGLTLDMVWSSPITNRQSPGRLLCRMTLASHPSHPWSAAIARGAIKWGPLWAVVFSLAWHWSTMDFTLTTMEYGWLTGALSLLICNALFVLLTPTSMALHGYLSGLHPVLESLPINQG
jgi:hypothetical protein